MRIIITNQDYVEEYKKMVDLKNRKISVFRCHIDPVIPGLQAKNAFDVSALGGEAELTPIGVWLKLPLKGRDNQTYFQEHVIPFANIQAVRLENSK